jgi:hypothetical protein
MVWLVVPGSYPAAGTHAAAVVVVASMVVDEAAGAVVEVSPAVLVDGSLDFESLHPLAAITRTDAVHTRRTLMDRGIAQLYTVIQTEPRRFGVPAFLLRV